jgi:two-component system, NarL family, sensor histidine kinase NreB
MPRLKTLLPFLLINGILTILTTLVMITTIFHMLGVPVGETRRTLPIFGFVLVLTTIFFWIIYWQGRRLKTEREQLVGLFEHLSEGMVHMDENFQVIHANQAARSLLGMKGSDTTLHFCGICSNFPGAGKMCTYDQCFVAEKEGMPVEVKIHSGKLDTSVSITTSHYKDAEGTSRYVLQVRQVAEDRRREQDKIAKMLTHSILQAQEKERKQISRELHDGIGQSLYGILIKLDVTRDRLQEHNPADAAAIESVLQLTRASIEDVRHLSAELRPSVLDDMGLVAALRHYIQNFGGKFGIQVNFSYEGDKSRLPAAMETALYRIIQEALTNVAKYAGTDRADVILNQSAEQVLLRIVDFGAGFTVNRESRNGVGLYSMEERTGIIGGEFHIKSSPGKGTTIEAVIPLRKEGGDLVYTGSARG